MMKVFDTCVISDKKFAILVNDEDMTAYEAVETSEGWETDFSYPAIGVDSLDVAGALNFAAAREAGYRFPDDRG